MSEEKLYIDDGELVYYINENEFIACDEIPMPMLEGIKDLQQKVEQLENIRKEAIKWVKLMGKYENGSCTRNFKLMSADFNYLLNILNKGDNNGK